ncbi:MAG: two-component system sensor histidine kinase/response regulator, partial [Symploca sp. SIO2B6]|nr:two-component system sensor histidine kinase/response regulator [Symploca sp. SIO2B6]
MKPVSLSSQATSETSLRHQKQRNLATPRHLLLRAIIGGTALLVSASAYWSYRAARQLILDNLRANAFAEVQNGTNEIDRWLTARKAEITVLANTPILQSLDWTEVEPYLQAIVLNQENFFKFALAYPDGTRYNTSGATRAKGSIIDRPNFREAIAGHLFVSDPIISRSTGIPQVNIAHPIYSPQPAVDTNPLSSIIGVSIGSLAVDRVTEIVSQLKYGSDSYPFAINS